jgi:hypothetical protein
MFQIKFINIDNKTEVKLNFQINQKKDDLLFLIKQFLGGNIEYSKIQNKFLFLTNSFESAKNIINYFDNFHLLSSNHVNYLK